MGGGGGERERGREGERARERQRETERETDRQTDRQTERDRDRDIVVNVAGHFLILWGYWGCHIMTGTEETVILRERGGERGEGEGERARERERGEEGGRERERDVVVNVAGHFLILWGYWGCHVMTGTEETVIMRERGRERGEREEGGREGGSE